MPAFERRSYENGSFSPISIVGLILASLVLLTIVISILVRYVRKRNVSKRESTIGAAFLDVKGLVVESNHGQRTEKAAPPPFSRSKLTPSIILPSKAYTRSSPSTPQNYPSDFTFPTIPTARPCGPFGFALDACAPRSSFMSTTSTGSGIRFSMASFLSIGTTSSYRASTVTPPVGGGTDTRRVHQPFSNPLSPDELLVTSPGERLTIFHSYDDGWCAVGRKHAFGLAQPSPSPFRKEKGAPQADVEVGFVPAWCFMRPVKGVRVERPVRVSSLGATAMKQPVGERDNVVSWSHF